MVETFDVGDNITHDAAGNLTYDGQYCYAYDAWNRLVSASRAYPDTDSDGAPELGSVIATMAYDGLGRRISKTITGCGDWDRAFRYDFGGRWIRCSVFGGSARDG